MATAVHPEYGEGGDGGGMSEARDIAQEEGRRAAAQSGELWRDAKNAALARVNDQQEAAAKSIGDIAGALRSAAHHLEDRGEPTARRFADYAADGLERLSTRLRDKDLDGMVREVESFARAQPVAFFGAALAAGFLAVRFLKSSDSGRGTTTYPSGYEE